MPYVLTLLERCKTGGGYLGAIKLQHKNCMAVGG